MSRIWDAIKEVEGLRDRGGHPERPPLRAADRNALAEIGDSLDALDAAAERALKKLADVHRRLERLRTGAVEPPRSR